MTGVGKMGTKGMSNNVKHALDVICENGYKEIFSSVKKHKPFICLVMNEQLRQDYLIIDYESKLPQEDEEFHRHAVELYADFENVERWYNC